MGNHTVAATASDAAGNSASDSITIDVLDVGPPSIAITAPANGASVSGMITVSGTASDNVSVSAVDVQVDGGSFNPASGTTNWSYSLDTTGLANGNHGLNARATDSSGNSASASITVNVNNDATAPTVAITAPADGASVSGTVPVAGTAADNTGVSSVDVSVDGGASSPQSPVENPLQRAAGPESWRKRPVQVLSSCGPSGSFLPQGASKRYTG